MSERLGFGQIGEESNGKGLLQRLRDLRLRKIYGGVLSAEQIGILAAAGCRPDWVGGSSTGQVPYNISPEGHGPEQRPNPLATIMRLEELGAHRPDTNSG